MLFLDEVTIFAKGGNGGNGTVSFKRSKYLPDGGPDGGNGGNGGNIYVVAHNSLNTLIDYRHRKKHIAPNGKCGRGNQCAGKSGCDMFLQVPIGTQIFDETDCNMLHDLKESGDTCLLVCGGRGGVGNSVFKSSTIRSPRIATNGQEGESGYFILRFKLVADVGIIGLPNVGKSSFLVASSRSKTKVADYAFTTVYPMPGFVEVENFDGFVMVDVPGIVGNSKSLLSASNRFLRHVERCSCLLHLMSATSDDVIRDYKIVRDVVELYNNSSILSDKIEIIAISKIDNVSDEVLSGNVELLEQYTGKKCYLISSLANIGIAELNKLLYQNCHIAAK